MKKRQWFGDKEFYLSVARLAVPIMIQNGITTFVNMLDNIMVGQIGTLPMSAASISNQLFMIFNLAVFGSNNAAGIFGAQFFGKDDRKGVKHCFHFKVYISVFIALLGITLFVLFGKNLIGLFLNEGTNGAAEILETMNYARIYMLIMLVGLPAFTLTQAFSSTVRESGETVLPMISSIAAVLVNFVGNYTLIFGHFGFPKLGIIGAALATVISRYVELAIIAVGTLRRKDTFYFLQDFFKEMGIPGKLVGSIAVKGAPLVANEVLWSTAITWIVQCYSLRGLNAVAAVNINSTIQNVFMITNMAMGASISIMVGQRLGANKIEEAVDTDWKLIVFAVLMASFMGCLMFILSPVFPRLYNTSDEVRRIAGILLRINACYMPISALYMAGYFTMRCGGKTVLTFLFDSVYTCLVNLPIAFCLSRFTTLPVTMLYLCVQCADIPKAILGVILVRKQVWVQNLVGTD